jgi:hypothetical protein
VSIDGAASVLRALGGARLRAHEGGSRMNRLRLSDLKSRHATEAALLAVRIPSGTVHQIRTMAKGLHVSVRDVVVALLNEGLDEYQKTRASAARIVRGRARAGK